MADDTFKKTPDDQFVSTDADKWLIDCTVSIGDALAGTWAVNQPVPAVDIGVAKQDLAYTVESGTTQTVINLPAKQDLTYTLNTPIRSATFLDSGQALTWTVNDPSISTTTGKTVSPDDLTLTWSLKGVTISAGDYFVDTDADAWVSGSDRWAFRDAGGTVDTTIQVDKQDLTWSQETPVVTFDNTVYPYGYLKNEAGFPIRDEAGNPIPLEGAMDGTSLTWSIQSPTISKTPEAEVFPNELDLTWTLNAPVTPVISLPDALALTYTVNDPVIAVYVYPEKSDLTWTVGAPTILGDTIQKPDALNLTWTLYAPRVAGTGLGRSRRRGLLLGVYR